MSFLFHKRLQSPTAIEQCLEAHLISPDVVNLIVARGSVLEIYDLIERLVNCSFVSRFFLKKQNFCSNNTVVFKLGWSKTKFTSRISFIWSYTVD
jgi:hypothetical protein